MTTPADLITTARTLYNDADSTLYRRSDLELLGYVNDGIREVSGLRPELFNTIGDMTCVPGDVEQKLTFEDAQAIVNVLCIHGGNAITRFDLAVMDAFIPGWRAVAAGAAQQWTALPGDPLRFLIYPKALANQVLDIVYVRIPLTLGLADPITEVPAAYTPALVDYIVYRAESADDEHSNSGRATAHYQAFVAKIKG